MNEFKKTKIICTIGRIEGNLSEEINKFVTEGMDVARINMAHYDLDKAEDRTYLETLIDEIRKLGKSGKDVAILGDIQGPKTRVKKFFGMDGSPEVVTLKERKNFFLTLDQKEAEKKALSGKIGALLKQEGGLDFFRNIISVPDEQKKDEKW